MKVSSLVALAMLSSVAFAQNPQSEIDTHLTAARNAAGFDFTGTLARLCVAPAFTTGIRDAAPGKPPARETWFTEPAKVFDNLYFVGSKIHSSWALTTSDGIILIDTLYTYNSEEEIVGGLKKLGLDPAKVKYVIITHAHGDHVGGAKLMQDRFKSHIVMGGPDWDSIEKSVNGYPEGKPKRDIVADDGQKLTLGDTTVTILTTPGHTPGTLSMIFPVKDHGRTLQVAYAGGTAFNFPSTVPNDLSGSSALIACPGVGAVVSKSPTSIAPYCASTLQKTFPMRAIGFRPISECCLSRTMPGL